MKSIASDVLLLLGLACLVVAGFLLNFVAGLAILGVALVIIAAALDDVKMPTLWRS